ncbi:MAG: tRNA (N(6)-L-threonylcarbamoyladenosine(37)-C(2))-methylthiotransferase MtaB [Desulfobulbaceae bacterium]|nr:tRNA (N(6)-L-threonylcarbamoyladenosine(37)-C(2))-methylthiotransferase MtaB [Desulfobulbaceae bacterium]
MKKFAITTLGCKVNQFESASFISFLSEAGCEMVPFSSPADIYIINTCAVTGRAGQQSRQLIRRAMKTNPEARIVVTGCYAQMDPQKVLEITENPLCIVGNGNKHLLVDAVMAESACDLTMLMGNISLKREITPMQVLRFPGRTRAFLRIQDGCNNFCSYCIVPFTRGRSRSLPIKDVLSQAAVFSAEGYREIVVTGINVGKYGADLEEGENICSLFARLCGDFPDIRFRLSSIEPTEVDDTLLHLMSSLPNFMPHLHIPLQSGDDTILKKMNRRYKADEFTHVISKIRDVLPDAAIGCDILCGFPGENQKAHENTFRLIENLPITYLHVFPYSKRSGTLAASMKNQLSKQIKDERVKKFRSLDSIKRETFYARFVGTVQQVLIEKRNKKNKYLQGFSENYLPVQCDCAGRHSGEIVAVHIDRLDDGELFGTVTKS